MSSPQPPHPPQPPYSAQQPNTQDPNPYGTLPPSAPPRPSLTGRQTRGAIIAGAAGFSLVSSGLGVGLIALAVGVVALVGAAFFGLGAAMEFPIDLPEWVAPVVGGVIVAAVVVALLLVAGGLVVSRWVLGAHGVARPWPVTWAGAGIAMVGALILGGIASVPTSLVAELSANGSDVGDGIGAIVGTASIAVGFVVNAAVGAAAWWLMAFAMRPRESPHPASGSSS